MGEIYVTSLDDLKLPAGGYVLVLPGWYPTWLDPFAGDFNQRHVRAIGLKVPQLVLYIGKDQTGNLSKTEVRYRQLTNRVIEIIVLYPMKKPVLWDTMRSNLTFFYLLNKFSNIITNKWGKPLLLHSYIVIRGGVAGCWLGKKWKLPVALTENWTIYYPADQGYLLKRNIFFRNLVKAVFANLDMFLPVTDDLRRQVFKLMKETNFAVIPNVVDTESFTINLENVRQSPFRFVHISTMTYQKNPTGLLDAFRAFSQKHTGCTLWMVGPYPKDVWLYANKLGLTDGLVIFKGELSYHDVSSVLKQSNALVLFSRYENLPCVILEALCCGVPVISTNVGGIAEVINDGNGILLEGNDNLQLENALLKMYSGYAFFNRKKIAEEAVSRFSYSAVANEIIKSYNRLPGVCLVI